MTLRFAHCFAFGALLILSFSSGATVVYDESVNGDLSDSAAAPTTINLGLGSNEIIGTIGVIAGAPNDQHDALDRKSVV